jgi:glycosyltransferase involved in cell wall biosynthesis
VNVLILADAFPTPDRNSADFRLTRLMAAIAADHDVYFVAVSENAQVDALGSQDVARYRNGLESLGVKIVDGGAMEALRTRTYAAVVFEWFFVARHLIEDVRALQPDARVIVDSVDVVFNRLEAKARVTKLEGDAAKASETKTAELAVYNSADLVIVVTDADGEILHRHNPGIATFTIPNIHPLQDPVPLRDEDSKRLLFVGSFVRPGGETNVDAMLYFCGEILPPIVAAVPDVRLRIIGSSPDPEITALASSHVEVLGFVPETRPYLETSAISIAPLRFGGGMKGKIGEAMSFGLPVVTTSTGIEGFGLEANVDALVADTPQEFADAVIRLLRDRDYLERVRMSGHRFIREHYSDSAVKARVDNLFAKLDSLPLKRMALAPALLRKAKESWERHVGWRLR